MGGDTKDQFEAMVTNFAQHRIRRRRIFPNCCPITPRRPMKHSIKRPSFCSIFNNSGSPMEDFIERNNIAHYRDRLKTEIDRFRRVILYDLLAEEEAKQASHVKPKGEKSRGLAASTLNG
jgi:hypothetical protein